MHDFSVKNGTLYCEQVPLERIAAKAGTPVFVYSRRTLLEHLRKLREAFSGLSPLICYSMKANSNLAICRLLTQAGAGLDIVSGGELFRAKKIGVPGEKIVYASVGKTAAEIGAALEAGILLFNAESIPELESINRLSGKMNRKQAVAIRLNPGVEARTHRYITTAKKENKFGIDPAAAEKIFLRLRRRLTNLDVCGIHFHIGSQIIQAAPFMRALRKTLKFIDALERRGVSIKILNIGGGLGIIYRDENPQTAEEYARQIVPLLRGRNLRIILEPGRFITGNAGILLTRIICVKDTSAKRFIIADAAMNDLIRPALYGAYHEIVPVRSSGRPGRRRADIVGAVCESSDFLGKDRLLPADLRPDDLLAVMSAGAYAFSMSGNYNSRCRAAEVLVAGNRFCFIRKRETFDDIIRNEIVCLKPKERL